MSKIVIDRAAVEQALDAFAFAYNACESDWAMDKKIDPAIKQLEAALEQPQVEQEPIRWPANASEVRAFLSGHVAAERYARDDHQPDDSDTYTLSAHDLLGAIDWWTDFDPQPPRQPLTKEEIAVIAAACGGLASDFVVSIASAIEVAHGIGGEK